MMIGARHLTKRYGQTVAAHDITLVELATHSATLEEAFFDLTRHETDYHATQLTGSSKGI
jgi:hypothetical protein